MPPRIGKMNNIQKFDSTFFDIPASEAHVLDPGFRILLEHTYEAIIDAGVNPAELQGTNTSVVTAICFSDSDRYLIYEKPQVCASRISYSIT